MYTDEDLDLAVKEGVLTESSVANFREHYAARQNSPNVDEENFRLVSSFNDIFVVIAIFLLLYSAEAAVGVFGDIYGKLAAPILSWGVAEYFVRQRKMAFPAIVLLLYFVGSVFSLGIELFGTPETKETYMYAAALASVAAVAHYFRFRVPITVAAGTAAFIGVFIAAALAYFPASKNMLYAVLFISGFAAFVYAMYWDSSDLERHTRRSDTAFWLHLLAAPLIVHPVFNFLGIFEGDAGMASMITVIVLYLFMTMLSLVVDRRAFMVSSLVYVLYAISVLLKSFGAVSTSFSVTGVCIGAALLLLSAFWHPTRKIVMQLMPPVIQRYVPAWHK